MVVISIAFRDGARTMVAEAAALPKSTCVASSRFPIVAEMPHSATVGRIVRRRARASSVCTPRLLPMSSCHSSTTIVSRLPKNSAAPL